MSPLIETDGLGHCYGSRRALAEVSLSLGRGVTGLLGPNGAGKSTLLSLLATALPVREGSVTIAGHPLGSQGMSRARRMIGYLPQRFEVMGWSSVHRNVEYAAWARGLSGGEIPPAVERALADVGLADRARSRARSLSGGMRQRLGIACATVHRPAVVILDEPTVGLDPLQRTGIRSLLDTLGAEACVLVSTHLVEDLASIAESVVILGGGEVRFNGSVGELVAQGSDAPADLVSSPIERGYHSVIGAAAC